ncbi:BLOC-1-related complex subunit 6 isoform X2 [Onthophagus taurus]|uniref:BLOC-1-related complex subunit 6 isoform X2 n=1 Tax=Onthophagus taurus TaxID=166361 RepID=UPI000C207C69|nr:BLOC-1-related complex subunit 6 isoform X3 [Onthophagus taurus]
MESKENQENMKEPNQTIRPKSLKPEDNDDNDDDISQQMTASYSEISFKSGLSPDEPNDVLKRPVTLCDDTKGLGPLTLEDLEYKIKISSPQAKNTPTHSRHPKQIGSLDVGLLNDLEIEAQHLATSVDNLTENLCGILHSISSITADNVDVYKNAVSKMSDDMDANIKSMYTMMAKAEEVTQTMKSVDAHANRVKEIKRLVDLFESYL